MVRHAVARGLLRPVLTVRHRLRGSQMQEWTDSTTRRWAGDTRSGAGIVSVAGDSIAAGLSSDLLPLPPDRWANRGLPGATIAEFAERLNSALVPSPDMLFLQLGTNDVLRGHEPIAIRADYAALLGRCRADSPATTVVVMAMPPISPWRANVELHATAAQELADVSAQHGCAHLRPWQGHEPRRVLQRDGVHLTEFGYELMAGAIAAAISAAGEPAATDRV